MTTEFLTEMTTADRDHLLATLLRSPAAQTLLQEQDHLDRAKRAEILQKRDLDLAELDKKRAAANLEKRRSAAQAKATEAHQALLQAQAELHELWSIDWSLDHQASRLRNVADRDLLPLGGQVIETTIYRLHSAAHEIRNGVGEFHVDESRGQIGRPKQAPREKHPERRTNLQAVMAMVEEARSMLHSPTLSPAEIKTRCEAMIEESRKFCAGLPEVSRAERGYAVPPQYRS